MDRICQHSGRGLTTYEEDKYDGGENIREFGLHGNVDDNPNTYNWGRIHSRKGQRRVILPQEFDQHASWTRSTLEDVGLNAVHYAENHLAASTV